jgi:amidase
MAASESELIVLRYELKADLNAYLQELISSPVRTLEEIITFNEKHAEQELAYFGQEHFIEAQKTAGLHDPIYLNALEEIQRLARQEGIDAVMDHYQLDALVMPTTAPAWPIDLINGDHYTGSSAQPAALAGYPAISVPAGEIEGLPIGITFMGRAFSEPTLIKLAYAFEQATQHRRAPHFQPTLFVSHERKAQ